MGVREGPWGADKRTREQNKWSGVAGADGFNSESAGPSGSFFLRPGTHTTTQLWSSTTLLTPLSLLHRAAWRAGGLAFCNWEPPTCCYLSPLCPKRAESRVSWVLVWIGLKNKTKNKQILHLSSPIPTQPSYLTGKCPCFHYIIFIQDSGGERWVNMSKCSSPAVPEFTIWSPTEPWRQINVEIRVETEWLSTVLRWGH